MSGVLMRHLRRDADDSEAFAAVLGQPTIRVFRPGTEAEYAFEVYDGVPADETIATITALLRDGREVYRSPGLADQFRTPTRPIQSNSHWWHANPRTHHAGGGIRPAG